MLDTAYQRSIAGSGFAVVKKVLGCQSPSQKGCSLRSTDLCVLGCPGAGTQQGIESGSSSSKDAAAATKARQQQIRLSRGQSPHRQARQEPSTDTNTSPTSAVPGAKVAVPYSPLSGDAVTGTLTAVLLQAVQQLPHAAGPTSTSELSQTVNGDATTDTEASAEAGTKDASAQQPKPIIAKDALALAVASALSMPWFTTSWTIQEQQRQQRAEAAAAAAGAGAAKAHPLCRQVRAGAASSSRASWRDEEDFRNPAGYQPQQAAPSDLALTVNMTARVLDAGLQPHDARVVLDTGKLHCYQTRASRSSLACQHLLCWRIFLST